jgi:hypothetical protein
VRGTEDLPPAVRSFDRAGGKIRRVKAGAIERRLEQKVDAFSRLEHADERFLERAAVIQRSTEPAAFKYMVEAIMIPGVSADSGVLDAGAVKVVSTL